MSEGREQALDRMIEGARELGAGATVRFSTSYIMGNVAEILVFGIAVTVARES